MISLLVSCHPLFRTQTDDTSTLRRNRGAWARNLGVFQGATATSLTVLYSVPANLALTFSIGLQLIEALLGVGIGFVFLSMEGLSVAELQTEVEAEAETEGV